MTRPEAIALRLQQLQGKPIDSALLAEAIAVIQQPERKKPGRRAYHPDDNTIVRRLRLAIQKGDNAPIGLLGARARANRALLKNLQRARGAA